MPESLWSQGIDPRGTPAEDYLRSRGLTLTDAARKALRFHPHPKYPAGWGPTLLAAFQDIETDELTGIHRIRRRPAAAVAEDQAQDARSGRRAVP